MRAKGIGMRLAMHEAMCHGFVGTENGGFEDGEMVCGFF